jgi:hypothetical protein
METKKCKECGEIMDIHNFYRDGHSNKGVVRYRRECKFCYNTVKNRNTNYKIDRLEEVTTNG